MTYKETFEKYLTPKIAELAIENTLNNGKDINNQVSESESIIGEALICGFIWNETKQKHKFWAKVFKSVCEANIQDI